MSSHSRSHKPVPRCVPMANRRTTVEVNGVDVTDQFEAVALEGREVEKAQESLVYLLKEHFKRASDISVLGKFTLGFSLTFDRLPGRTSIKAKVSYSRKFTDEVEAFAQLHEQGSLLEEVD